MSDSLRPHGLQHARPPGANRYQWREAENILRYLGAAEGERNWPKQRCLLLGQGRRPSEETPHDLVLQSLTWVAARFTDHKPMSQFQSHENFSLPCLTFLPLLNSNPGRAGADSKKGESGEDSTPTPHLCGLSLFPPAGLNWEGEDDFRLSLEDCYFTGWNFKLKTVFDSLKNCIQCLEEKKKFFVMTEFFLLYFKIFLV